MPERNSRSRRVSPEHCDRVKRVWNLYGATQKNFANELRIAVSTFRKFLNGEAVDKQIFDHICDLLDLEPAEISQAISASPTNQQSPFIIGNPITEPRYFFGRGRELKRIFQILDRHPLQNVAIIGDKRIGKTSLLRYIQSITQTSVDQLRQGQKQDWLTNPDRYRWVFIDFQNPNLQSERGLIEYILKSLGVHISRECDRGYFMDIMPQNLQCPTIILFDEIANVLQNCPELDDRFWESLRSLATNYAQGNLAYILATPISPFDLGRDYGSSSPFLNIFGHTIKLGALTETEARELIASAPYPFSVEDVDWILEQSRCLPLLLQTLCHECWLSLEFAEDGNWRVAALEQIAPYLPNDV